MLLSLSLEKQIFDCHSFLLGSVFVYKTVLYNPEGYVHIALFETKG